MPDRPPIPEELRRRILVEAGHRCAIQTCQHAADIDVHHIIPWATVKEHTLENLIALCPNCHRRADAGEIDRTALRMYKARLTAALDASPEPSGATLGGQHPWEVQSISESGEPGSPYEIQTEYPVFRGEGWLAINAIESGLAWFEVATFRSDVVGRTPIPNMPDSRLVAAFSVLYFDEAMVSLRFSFLEYRNGGAHGGQRTETRTYLRQPEMVLGFHQLTIDPDSMLDAVSRFCVTVLEAELGDGTTSDWIRKGAAPRAANFRKWNLTPVGLLVTFDEYDVAPYGAGRQQVLVPYPVISRWGTPVLLRAAKNGQPAAFS